VPVSRAPCPRFYSSSLSLYGRRGGSGDGDGGCGMRGGKATEGEKAKATERAMMGRWWMKRKRAKGW